MPTPLAKVPLTFPDHPSWDIQRADLSIYLELATGLDEVPETRGEDTIVPGAAGRRVRGRVLDRLALELVGYVQGVGTTDVDRLSSYRSAVESLRLYFDPTTDPLLLHAELEDGTFREYRARCISGGIVYGPETIRGVRRVSVALECVSMPTYGLRPAPVTVTVAVPVPTVTAS